MIYDPSDRGGVTIKNKHDNERGRQVSLRRRLASTTLMSDMPGMIQQHSRLAIFAENWGMNERADHKIINDKTAYDVDCTNFEDPLRCYTHPRIDRPSSWLNILSSANGISHRMTGLVEHQWRSPDHGKKTKRKYTEGRG